MKFTRSIAPIFETSDAIIKDCKSVFPLTFAVVLIGIVLVLMSHSN